MRYFLSAALLFLGLSAPAAAAPGDMTVAEFLARANAVKAKGMLAIFSPDYRTLKNEGASALRGYRAQLAVERAEGRPSSCPPRTVRVDTDIVLNHLRTYPASERGRVDLHQAVADYHRRTWPCRGPSFAQLKR